jgi:hypothetical protein
MADASRSGRVVARGEARVEVHDRGAYCPLYRAAEDHAVEKSSQPAPGDVLHHGPAGETVFAVVSEVPLVASVRQAALLAQVLDQPVRLYPVEDHRHLGLSAEQAKRDPRPVPWCATSTRTAGELIGRPPARWRAQAPEP